MGKKLAIKGHPTRGKEVIELLEMIGGTNPFSHNGMAIGNKETNCYYISENTVTKYISWSCIGSEEINEYKIFTLEEFLEKYPYKIGDKIPDVWGNSCTVKSMSWDDNYKTVMYGFKETVFVVRGDELKPINEYKPLFKAGDVVKLKGCPDKNLFWIVMDVVKDGYIFNDGKKYPFDDQHHYEKSNREVLLTTPKTPSKMKNVLAELLEHIKTTPKEDLEREFEEIVEWSNVGPTVEEFRTFCECVNKKPKYPTTYEECVRIAKNIHGYDINIDAPAYRELLESFVKLLICRDAYWKIAGEEMGLGKPWEPDWTNEEQKKYCIYYGDGNVKKGTWCIHNSILAFPTEEIRDIFYENFKDLIERCKELL